jgi:hypothetical protein
MNNRYNLIYAVSITLGSENEFYPWFFLSQSVDICDLALYKAWISVIWPYTKCGYDQHLGFYGN